MAARISFLTEQLNFFSTRDWAASPFLEIEAKFSKIEAKILDISDMASRVENCLTGLFDF